MCKLMLQSAQLRLQSEAVLLQVIDLLGLVDQLLCRESQLPISIA
jgi:hypothetical protein